jgi:hypothetical protein
VCNTTQAEDVAINAPASPPFWTRLRRSRASFCAKILESPSANLEASLWRARQRSIILNNNQYRKFITPTRAIAEQPVLPRLLQSIRLLPNSGGWKKILLMTGAV